MSTSARRVPGIRWKVTAVAMMAALLAGCAEAHQGSSRPAPLDAGDRVALGKTLLGDQRPRALSLVGMTGERACALLTEQQRQELGVETTARVSDHLGNTGCVLTSASRSAFRYTIQPVPQEGADVWLRAGPTHVGTEVSAVAGFPAVRNWQQVPAGQAVGTCAVDVSVADNQRLAIRYDRGVAAPQGSGNSCELATKAAEMAMATFLAQ